LEDVPDLSDANHQMSRLTNFDDHKFYDDIADAYYSLDITYHDKILNFLLTFPSPIECLEKFANALAAINSKEASLIPYYLSRLPDMPYKDYFTLAFLGYTSLSPLEGDLTITPKQVIKHLLGLTSDTPLSNEQVSNLSKAAFHAITARKTDDLVLLTTHTRDTIKQDTAKQDMLINELIESASKLSKLNVNNTITPNFQQRLSQERDIKNEEVSYIRTM
ncbi:MAG: hypothetical protein ACK4M7_04980, partial [Burkholderiales bacterium]